MNHEHQPRHRSETEHQRTPSDSDAYIADAVAHAPTPEHGRAIAAAYAKYGTAFALFLDLGDADTDVEGNDQDAADVGLPLRIERAFNIAYYGRFPTRDTLIDDTIESFDWGYELDYALRDVPDLRAMVTFDRRAIWGFIGDHYQVIDGEDGFYVFERRP